MSPATAAATEPVVELDIPASLAYLGLARTVVASVAAAGGQVPPERVEDLRLAVSEACANAIAAHTRSGSGAAVRIRCEVREDRLEVAVTDEGPGFDPDELAVLPAPADPRRLEYEHGLGIQLMQAYADRAEIRTSPNGTLVRLVLYTAPGYDG